MENRQIYRRFLFKLLGLAVTLFFVFSYFYIRNGLPDSIYLTENEDSRLVLQLPPGSRLDCESQAVAVQHMSDIPKGQVDAWMQESFRLCGQKAGKYEADCYLFGIIPLKKIEMTVTEPVYLYPSGRAVGLYLQSSGILVIGTGTVYGSDHMTAEPARGKLQSGDYILSVNGCSVPDKESLTGQIEKSGGRPLTVVFRRDGEEMTEEITPALDSSGRYCLGIWVRDDTQGIGTMTYVTEEGDFGALGHGISDADTGNLMEAEAGSLYPISVYKIIPGKVGGPGSISGGIVYGESQIFGTIDNNTLVGVYGHLSGTKEEWRSLGLISEEKLPAAGKEQVEEGTAYIRSDVSGEPEDYEVEILRLNRSDRTNKGIIFRVTDPRLLEITGGVVMGMSGSALIQNGKIIGAVTHVFINDPTKGYGIFIENMLSQ